MRTLDEITANISLISQTMNGIESQISLLDDEYQKAAIENIGEPYEEWTEMRGNYNPRGTASISSAHGSRY